MAVVTRTVFLDTSVLLAGLIETGHGGEAAQHVMDAIAEGRLAGCQTAWHCCLEFYSVATRLPAEYRLSPPEAFRLLEAEVFGRFEVCELPKADRLPMLRAAADEGVAGGRAYDAHIAEIARAAGAEIVLTDNRRHFTSLLRHGIVVQTASEFEAALRRGRPRRRP